VLSIDGEVATVDFFGASKPVLLMLLDEPVVPGDYLLEHLGYARRKIQREDVAETIAMYEQLTAP
jgi:hydrogenase expression/formation protein HypC